MPKTIKMLRDMPVSLNGYDVEKWLGGEIREDVVDALADELLHEQTLAAIEVTGDAKADAAAEKAAIEEAARRAAEAKAAAEAEAPTSKAAKA